MRTLVSGSWFLVSGSGRRFTSNQKPETGNQKPFLLTYALLAAVLAAGCGTHQQPTTQTAAGADPVTALHHDVSAILDVPAFAHGRWSALVRSLKTGGTLYARDAESLAMPASNMKVLTTSVAAERLGWDFRFETRLVALGPIHDGVLDGDLLVIGSGDPTLDTRTLESWAIRLRAGGLTRVRGRIIADDDALEEPGWGFGWSWDDLVDGYAAPIGALQLAENTAELVLSPGLAPGQPVSAALAPADSGLLLENLAVTGTADGPASHAYRRRAGERVITITGTIPVSTAPLHETVALDDPTRYFATQLERVLEAGGVAVIGGVVDIDDLPRKPEARGGTVLLSHRSAPLRDVIRWCLKVSSNLYAETLLETLGRDVAHNGTTAAGLRIVHDTLSGWKLPVEPLVMRDGSGLSRYNYVTAALLVAIHAHMAADATHAAPWTAALPVSGRDGTLASRMTGIEGRVHAKTGSLSNVRALSGYVVSADGEPLVFAVIGNHFEVPPAEITGAIDRVVERLAAFRR